MMFFCLAFSWTLLALGQQPIELVPWEKLADFIEELVDWTKKGDLEGIHVPVPAKSEVWQGYVAKTGQRSLEINIMDSAKSMINLIPIKGMMHNRQGADGYVEKITLKGFPGAKIYDTSQKEAGLIVLIQDRFVLQMFGHNFTAAEVPDLVEAAKKHNLEGIAELGNQPPSHLPILE